MTEFQISEVTNDDIAALRADYLAKLAAPFDGMWEAFAGMATPWAFSVDGKLVGFAAVNGERQILQFFLRNEFDARDLFARLIGEQDVKGAVVPSCDTQALALALDHQKSLKTAAIMYDFPAKAPNAPAQFPADTEFTPVTPVMLDQAVQFAHQTLGASEEWLNGYFAGLVSRHELFALWQDGQIIATGECRVSDTQQGIADVGMVVGKNNRRSGIATNVLRALAEEARAKALQPICSTETSNIGAQKAITRAGFVSTHRILDITF